MLENPNIRNLVMDLLLNYETATNNLYRDISDSLSNANVIRDSLNQLLVTKFALLDESNQPCHLCNLPLVSYSFSSSSGSGFGSSSGFGNVHTSGNSMGSSYNQNSKNIYVFPCQHSFHADCLIKHIQTSPFTLPINSKLIKSILVSINDLSKKKRNLNLKLLSSDPSPSSPSFSSPLSPITTTSPNTIAITNSLDSCYKRLDDLVAKDCVLCGEYIIKSINLPLFDFSTDHQSSSWSL
ncbi:hypothetical protein AX774_g7550 [Zancudomyces culisetae]|uniref:Pep3/Vps18 RING C-terminal domain-containing protein n=1 Tax=Zancudomyces culisetae TaxID=1213189 RepID=A0A1R1PDK3_ZANCU|nr:hypothetical protein AX774_g7550 [Zancudomyces culisetae]|eukprot:OMH79046.1 hypothetical protein AX774_g7550 [Zancudomyces culisetae]